MSRWPIAVVLLLAAGCAIARDGLFRDPARADGSAPDASVPDGFVPTDGPSPMVDAGPPPPYQVSAGDKMTCAVGSGLLTCWGKGSNNRLGLGDDADDHGSPQLVTPGEDWTAVAVGEAHACGLREGGRLFCWGTGMHDRLGFTSGDTGVPTEVLAGTHFLVAAAGGSHTCAIASDRRMWCWGRNNHGQLGRAVAGGEALPPETIADVGPVWETVSAGHEFVCAIARDGQLWCWGHNDQDQIGLGAAGAMEVPTPSVVAAGSQWAAIATGDSHACGVRMNGELYCWGKNSVGQVGTGEVGGAIDHPVAISGAARFWPRISARFDHTCAVRTDGNLLCWGENGDSQLGLGDDVDRLEPTELDTRTVPEWRGIAAGNDHTCAVARFGTIHCWGDNMEGQLGLGETDRMSRPVPTPLP